MKRNAIARASRAVEDALADEALRSVDARRATTIARPSRRSSMNPLDRRARDARKIRRRLCAVAPKVRARRPSNPGGGRSSPPDLFRAGGLGDRDARRSVAFSDRGRSRTSRARCAGRRGRRAPGTRGGDWTTSRRWDRRGARGGAPVRWRGRTARDARRADGRRPPPGRRGSGAARPVARRRATRRERHAMHSASGTLTLSRSWSFIIASRIDWVSRRPMRRSAAPGCRRQTQPISSWRCSRPAAETGRPSSPSAGFAGTGCREFAFLHRPPRALMLTACCEPGLRGTCLAPRASPPLDGVRAPNGGTPRRTSARPPRRSRRGAPCVDWMIAAAAAGASCRAARRALRLEPVSRAAREAHHGSCG